jgi:hypothetical protein
MSRRVTSRPCRYRHPQLSLASAARSSERRYDNLGTRLAGPARRRGAHPHGQRLRQGRKGRGWLTSDVQRETRTQDPQQRRAQRPAGSATGLRQGDGRVRQLLSHNNSPVVCCASAQAQKRVAGDLRGLRPALFAVDIRGTPRYDNCRLNGDVPGSPNRGSSS